LIDKLAAMARLKRFNVVFIVNLINRRFTGGIWYLSKDRCSIYPLRLKVLVSGNLSES
jgi:hypothetical protein